MPNHLTTLITIAGAPATVDAFVLAHIRPNEKGELFFDFASVVPAPPCVEATSRDPGPSGPFFGDAQVEYYARALIEGRDHGIVDPSVYHHEPSVRTWGDLIEVYNRKYPGIDKWARARLLCAAETGYPGWYEWNIANWGTKWGSYQYKERLRTPGSFVLEFQTAWSPPVPIFNKIADLYPDLDITTETIDEGGWEHAGHFHGTVRNHAQMPNDDARYARVMGHAREVYEDDEPGDAADANA